MADRLQVQELNLGDPRLPERFWAKVQKSDSGCWEWTANSLRGYGQFIYEGATRKTHRLVYETLVGPIPEGLALDHLCRNRGCCNPAHLEPVTWAENIHRGSQSKITMEIARDVRRRVQAGESNAQITAATGVTTQNIWWIAEDRAWREDPDAPRQPVYPIRDCLWCGEPVPAERGRRAKFCTTEHRIAAKRAKAKA